MTCGDENRTGVRLPVGGNMWLTISDATKKEYFQKFDDKEVLEKLASVDYSSWNYKNQDPESFRHDAIMAQEFYELFRQDDYGTIGTDTLVNPIDMIGITMSAIKGAILDINELEEENQILRNDLSVIEAELMALKELILNGIKSN